MANWLPFICKARLLASFNDFLMKISNKFELEQEVYLKTDTDQYLRLVTGIFVRPGGIIRYELTCGTEESCHYEFEIAAEIDMATKTK